MSSFKNAINSRAHRERAQPQARKKYGLLEKHKDYIIRAKAFHKKEDTLQKLRERAAFKNPDEFYFKMIRTRTVDGVHKPETHAKQYTHDELMLMKTQDIGYVLHKLQSENKRIGKLQSVLHGIEHHSESKHIYFAEDREEAKELQNHAGSTKQESSFSGIPERVRRKTDASYRELESRKKRAKDLERVFFNMSLQQELQKKGRKRKLREDEIVCPSSGPVYKWSSERKR